METFTKTIIPEALIYERVNGDPIYYRDYQCVLEGIKTPEQIMGSSYLQSLIISSLLQTLFTKVDLQQYKILTNEVGLQLGKNSERMLDIAIIAQDKLQDIVKEKYLPVAPDIVMEVDIKADASQAYVHQKTDQLLGFGLETVIWIFSESKKVVIAEKGKEPWQIFSWDKSFTILEDITLNLHDIVK